MVVKRKRTIDELKDIHKDFIKMMEEEFPENEKELNKPFYDFEKFKIRYFEVFPNDYLEKKKHYPKWL